MPECSKSETEGLRLAQSASCCEPAGRQQKIGILTFHRCINYGSYWQARCLLEGLQARGHDAVLLDHVSCNADVKEWRVALRPTLPTPVPRSDVEQYACKARKFFHLFDQLPLSRPFDLDRPETMEPVDTVVIGSDEVWNLRHPWYAAKPAFFGEGLPANRVISYAASFGNYSCWEGIGSPWTDLLSRLDAISVRDENTWWMLKNCIDRETDIVLDPCLQFPDVITKGSDRTWSGPNHSYLLVYGHNFSAEFSTEVRRWADARKLPVLSIGYRNDWAHAQWIAADPIDFAQAVARAEAVATNFFHGCVFSMLKAKPFACELTPYRSIKVRGLTELLGGESHLLGAEATAEEFEARLSEPIRPAILKKIDEVRQTSSNYLKTALQEHDGA